jgi:hypothetical protein
VSRTSTAQASPITRLRSSRRSPERQPRGQALLHSCELRPTDGRGPQRQPLGQVLSLIFVARRVVLRLCPERQPLEQALSRAAPTIEAGDHRGSPTSTARASPITRRCTRLGHGGGVVPNDNRSGKPYHPGPGRRCRSDIPVPNIKHSGKPCHVTVKPVIATFIVVPNDNRPGKLYHAARHRPAAHDLDVPCDNRPGKLYHAPPPAATT